MSLAAMPIVFRLHAERAATRARLLLTDASVRHYFLPLRMQTHADGADFNRLNRKNRYDIDP
jgi:hypothetical protein